MAESPDTHLIIIDSDPDFLSWAAGHLKAPGVTIVTCEKPEEGLAAYHKKRADLVLAEIRAGTGPASGIELLKRLRQGDPHAMVILFSGTATTSHVIEAMRIGAYDVLPKERLPYELRSVVESALNGIEARRQKREQSADVPAESIQETIIGRSPAMQEVFKLIGRVSRSDAPVMVTGESGCGKELVAGAIHKFSPRAQKEFAAINITAIPDNLIESEIFGHEKGSFTGAVNQRIGRFEQCDGGTLFLDEIGDMPLAVQSKLLRVLQEGQYSRVGSNQTLKTDVRVLAATNKNLEEEVAKGNFREDLFYRLNVVRIHIPPLAVQSKLLRVLQEGQYSRVGSNQTLKTDVRVLAATNKNLEEEVAKGTFREDLFYRLNVVRIHIPPLRERREDVRLLAEFFLQRQSARRRGPVMRFTDDALDILEAYDWPGNVRELENTIQRACALCNSDVLLPSDIPLGSKGTRHHGPASTVTRMRDALTMLVNMADKTPDIDLLPWIERELTRIVWRHCDENEARASKLLGVPAATLQSYLSAPAVKKAKKAS